MEMIINTLKHNQVFKNPPPSTWQPNTSEAYSLENEVPHN